jgi:hypothetical protein
LPLSPIATTAQSASTPSERILGEDVALRRGRAKPIARKSAIIHTGEFFLRRQRFQTIAKSRLPSQRHHRTWNKIGYGRLTPALILQLDGDQIPHRLVPIASFAQGSPGASGIVRGHLLSRRSKQQRRSREELRNRDLLRCPFGKRPLNRLKRSKTVSSLQTNKQKLAPPWSHHEIEQVRLLILEGKSLHAVSRRLGRTPQAVRKIASRLKLPLRSLHLMS